MYGQPWVKVVVVKRQTMDLSYDQIIQLSGPEKNCKCGIEGSKQSLERIVGGDVVPV